MRSGSVSGLSLLPGITWKTSRVIVSIRNVPVILLWETQGVAQPPPTPATVPMLGAAQPTATLEPLS